MVVSIQGNTSDKVSEHKSTLSRCVLESAFVVRPCSISGNQTSNSSLSKRTCYSANVSKKPMLLMRYEKSSNQLVALGNFQSGKGKWRKTQRNKKSPVGGANEIKPWASKDRNFLLEKLFLPQKQSTNCIGIQAKCNSKLPRLSSLPSTKKPLPKQVNCPKERHFYCKPNHKTYRKNIVSVSSVNRKKIFYSERQSQNVCGVPCAPPSTPYQQVTDFVASLSDLKSQRKVHCRLKKLEKKRIRYQATLLEKASENEKQKEIVDEENRKQFQRFQIYAMNKLMTELENQHFEEFKLMQQGAPV